MHQFPPQDEWLNRKLRLQQKLDECGMKGCLVSQNVGIYYFTGSMQTGYLFMPVEGEPTYYVRRSMERALKESRVRTVELGSFRSFGMQLEADYPELGEPSGELPLLGADLDVMPAQLYLRLADAIPRARLADASAILRNVRSVKSPYEIERISRAAEVVAVALETGLASLREGMTELELMSVIEYSIRRNEHIGLMRMRNYNQEIMTGIVASGEAAAEPSYFDGPAGGRGLSPASPKSVSLRPIGRNEPILIDIGCCVDGYVIDQTRTAVIGELDPDLRAAYDTAAEIMRISERSLRPGGIPEEIYFQAVEMAKAAGLSEHFMGFGRDQVKFLGHGIGLEIDEWPVLAKGFRAPLEPGMTIAVEPKFTFPGRGVVGVENTYLITEFGCKALTVSPEKIYALP
ncbi:M24 family metallopeptidase [Cohnella cholangitidis]|uniref:Aminopeptidase P family protein n=1 Tax=Cohnella cholangitidis TaxID=2598458 RepID=A0A7G5BVP8_9BACL|nr:Xaa-Pro peptidase family protein [Cohnella cholangitidis]QMV41032.1 aminopeptidase P family protein [Cohnella cholangitidis]